MHCNDTPFPEDNQKNSFAFEFGLESGAFMKGSGSFCPFLCRKNNIRALKGHYSLPFAPKW